MTGLEIRGLTKSYGSADPSPVLSGLDLTVEDGRLAAVLGPSGCGKTTLLRLIAGFLLPDGGRIEVGGQNVAGLPPERRRIGVVPQEGALFPHLSVAANVAFGLRGVGRTERRRRVAEMLDLVGLSSYGSRMPHEISGGQQQRVALARALAPRPRLVLLDEPFNALDTGLRTEVRADVCAALSATGATAVLVTHDQQEALSAADLVAVMRDGRIVQAASPAEVYERPADPAVARFVGDAVILPVSASNGAAATGLGEIPVDGGGRGGPGTIVLRPEQLRLEPPAPGRPTGRVTGVAYYGHDAVVTVAVDGIDGPVSVRVAGPVDLRPGERTCVAVTGNALFYPA